jgi:hypothetical protein
MLLPFASLASLRETPSFLQSSINNYPSSIVEFPPQTRIVMPFENPPDVFGVIDRLAYGVKSAQGTVTWSEKVLGGSTPSSHGLR